MFEQASADPTLAEFDLGAELLQIVAALSRDVGDRGGNRLCDNGPRRTTEHRWLNDRRAESSRPRRAISAHEKGEHMANAEHLQRIRSGEWNRWRAENPSAIPDLVGADLDGADLAGIDLRNGALEQHAS